MPIPWSTFFVTDILKTYHNHQSEHLKKTPTIVVFIGRLTAFYVVFIPLEYILSKPPITPYVIVS